MAGFNLYANGRCCDSTLDANCGDCSLDGNTCTACAVGYYLNGAVCTACSATLSPLCAECLQDGSSCTKCQPNYVL